MSQVVKDHYEEKVNECKEDVDTLLVFVSLTDRYLSKPFEWQWKAGLS